MELVLVLFSFIALVTGNPCERFQSVDITGGITYENGSTVHANVEYTAAEWYEVIENDEVKRYGCPCLRRACLWKCCGVGEALVGRSCNETAAIFSPPVYNGTVSLPVSASEIFFYIHTAREDMCESRYLVDSASPSEQIYVQQNATLHEVTEFGSQWHLPTRYCLDMMVDDVTEARLVAAVCYPQPEEQDSPVLFITYAIGLLISVPFLVATFLVYAFIPELRNLHGMCLMAYCGGLIVAYSLLAYLKLHVAQIGVEMTGCLVIAFVVYFAFQTSFFWLNVMCFDIWRTFSGYRGGSSQKKRELRRFMMYGIYAWGVPMVLTACTVGMQFNDNLSSSIIRPNIGWKRCWFDNWLSELSYFFGPVLVLVVINVSLFAITANRIRSIRQETAILKGAESARSDNMKRDKQRYGLYLKLFMVMGVNWIMELIGFAAGGSNWFWILLDLSNVQLGFFIFIIFVWKNKVRNLVRKRFRSLRGDSRLARDSARTGRWATQSSSAPTEDTRITSTSAGEDAGIRLRDIN